MSRLVVCIDCNTPSPRSPCKPCQKQRNTESYYQTAEWRAVRKAARAAHGSRCAIRDCKTPHYRVTMHHRKARKQSGSDNTSNLMPLCQHCHSRYESDKRRGKTTELTQAVERWRPKGG